MLNISQSDQSVNSLTLNAFPAVTFCLFYMVYKV